MTDKSPIPEVSFTWRRWFSWLSCMATLALLAYIVHQLQGNAALVEVAKWLIGLNALIVTYYMAAPTAEHITRMVQTARIFGGGPTPPPPPPSRRRGLADLEGRMTPDDPER